MRSGHELPAHVRRPQPRVLLEVRPAGTGTTRGEERGATGARPRVLRASDRPVAVRDARDGRLMWRRYLPLYAAIGSMYSLLAVGLLWVIFG